MAHDSKGLRSLGERVGTLLSVIGSQRVRHAAFYIYDTHSVKHLMVVGECKTKRLERENSHTKPVFLNVR